MNRLFLAPINVIVLYQEKEPLFLHQHYFQCLESNLSICSRGSKLWLLKVASFNLEKMQRRGSRNEEPTIEESKNKFVLPSKTKTESALHHGIRILRQRIVFSQVHLVWTSDDF